MGMKSVALCFNIIARVQLILCLASTHCFSLKTSFYKLSVLIISFCYIIFIQKMNMQISQG